MSRQRLVTTGIHHILSGENDSDAPEEGFLKSQIATLTVCVMGLIAGGEVSLAGIGRNLPGRVEPKHKIKRVDRFCGNKLIDVSPLCRPMLRALARGSKSLLVSVDWTKIDDFQVLVFAVTTRHGRAVPVYWEVIDPNEDRMKAVEIEAVDRFYALVPPSIEVTIMADRGFDEVKFIAAVAKRFQYVIRLAKSNTVSEKSDSPELANVFETLANKLTTRDEAVDFGRVLFTQANKFETRVIGLHARSKEDPWFLATSLQDIRAKVIVKMYARRFDIEHAFKDWKDVHHGWQLGSIRCTQTERLARLLMVPAVAFLMMILLGMLGESRNYHRGLQVNSEKTKRCLSLWRVGVLMCTTSHRRFPSITAKLLLKFLDVLALQPQGI